LDIFKKIKKNCHVSNYHRATWQWQSMWQWQWHVSVLRQVSFP